MTSWLTVEGSPLPLGVSWIEEEHAYNFALYSRHAGAVTLLLYAEQDVVQPMLRMPMNYLRHKSGRVWHCRLAASVVAGARYYAYTVDGPADGAAGQSHRFDREKVLFDPYARGLFFPRGFRRAASAGAGTNAGRAPLGELPRSPAPFDWGDDAPPRHTSDSVIYELHVKGFTMRPSSGVSAADRGAYAGVIEKIPYLRALGITVVELMPVFQYDPDEGNYWGYMPLSFFAVHQGYARDRTVAAAAEEFRQMVKALHAADIEVVLDVVYNHTAEGGADGPTYSYRGICNATYYLLDDDLMTYRDDTGTGNVLRSAHPAVRKLILDSLRFWVHEMHVDGFRFDLASIFSRNADGSINLDDPPVISEISSDPDFAEVRLIAEAWDPGVYELGRGFPGYTWPQWNGRFRDAVRSFLRGDPGMVGEMMTRMYGSCDLFPDDVVSAYHAYQSVNYVTSHDGLCLYDLVAYNAKHNEANGLGNRDGTDNNLSWNGGWEGDAGVPPEVVRLRTRQVKNFCCLLLLSNGTPMLRAGDEFMNTQGGNNNPFNQDNETSWLNWDLLERNRGVFRFFQGMIRFRKAHPSLGRSRFWRDDVNWYGIGAEPDPGYSSHSFAFCVHGGSQRDRDIYVMINAYWEDLDFVIQEGAAADWRRVVDTSLDSPFDYAEPGAEPEIASLTRTVSARSVVVLLRVP
jgi:glycogen operon protein